MYGVILMKVNITHMDKDRNAFAGQLMLILFKKENYPGGHETLTYQRNPTPECGNIL